MLKLKPIVELKTNAILVQIIVVYLGSRVQSHPQKEEEKLIGVFSFDSFLLRSTFCNNKTKYN